MKLYIINFYNYTDFIVLQKNKYINIIILKTKEFFKITIDNDKTDISIDKYTKSISFKYQDISLNNYIFRKINFYLKNKFLLFFLKIKFNGKGYRIQSFKTKPIINLTFGYSHMYYVYLNNVKYKRLSKYKYFFILKNNNVANKLRILINEVKPINKYTLRGLRLSKAIIVKRKGRKSPNI